MSDGTTVLVVLVVIGLGGLAAFFLLKPSVPKTSSDPGKGLGGVTDATCAIVAASAGIPIPPGGCGAIAPYLKDGAAISGKFGISQMNRAADLAGDLSNKYVNYVKTTTGVAYDIATTPAKVAGSLVNKVRSIF